MVTYRGDQVALLPLDTPGVPTLSRQGSGGETTYAYVVVARKGDGHTEASEATSLNNGPSSLGGSRSIRVTPPYVTGAASFDIYRTAGNPDTGRIGTVTPRNVGSTQLAYFNDRGQSAEDTAPPDTNTTGLLILSGLEPGTLVQVNQDGSMTALARGNFIASPSGGGTVDTEARAVIDSILSLLQNAAVMQGD